MQDGLIAFAVPSWAAIIDNIYPPETHEELKNEIARRMSWGINYLNILENDLSKTKKLATVIEAKLEEYIDCASDGKHPIWYLKEN